MNDKPLWFEVKEESDCGCCPDHMIGEYSTRELAEKAKANYIKFRRADGERQLAQAKQDWDAATPAGREAGYLPGPEVGYGVFIRENDDDVYIREVCTPALDQHFYEEYPDVQQS